MVKVDGHHVLANMRYHLSSVHTISIVGIVIFHHVSMRIIIINIHTELGSDDVKDDTRRVILGRSSMGYACVVLGSVVVS